MTMQQGGFAGTAFANPFASFLDEEPRAGYFAQQERFGRSPNQRRFFQQSFQPVYDRFLGQLGQQVQQGQAPTLQFAAPQGEPSFLQDFNFDQFFRSQPQFFQGLNTQQFAPSTRFLFF
tara:strand:+ start:2006 stop:2362 length:357 start_codon:yes stop_codon:yes gene_type:complete